MKCTNCKFLYNDWNYILEDYDIYCIFDEDLDEDLSELENYGKEGCCRSNKYLASQSCLDKANKIRHELEEESIYNFRFNDKK